MTFNTITHQSEAYREMINLRVRVLLQPIGIPASYIVPHKESEDILIGAYEEGRLVGCCVLTDRGNGLVQLRQMAVDTILQGTGVGAAIIRYAEATARENGYKLLYLHARNPVIGFYQKCGYTIVGEEFFEVELGHHRMEKDLLA